MADTHAAEAGGAPESFDVQRSSREPEVLRTDLERWLSGRLDDGASPAVRGLGSTAANGMSSDTVLFEASWSEGGVAHDERLVARIAPAEADVPVFASYDLTRQFETMRIAGELTSVPVPRVFWLEPDERHLGAPFFVMGRIDGEVPPDVMPYTFGGNWVADATGEQRRALQDRVVDVLAQLHGIDRPTERFAFLEHDVPGDTHLRRHVNHTRDWYDFAVRTSGLRSSLVERGFAWLEDNWPSEPGRTTLSWGDARIGNIMFRDFAPVAVLDWEMAGIGPSELDVAWLVFAHKVFEHLASTFELPGLPDFLRVEDVATRYESLTGYTPRDLDFYMTYAAVQWGIVFLRTGARQVHFGEIEPPEDPDTLLHHAGALEALLAT
jgi:aminoglycoside phosphotransferase (APT) family kinase protein